METVVVEAEPREEFGKGPSRRLRSKGMIPAVLYGEGKETVPVSVDPKEITKILRSHGGSNTIFELNVKGRSGSRHVMIKDYQLEPIEHRILHADLIRVAMDSLMTVSVHVELMGTPEGVKNQGGLLDFITRSVEVTCLPRDIPETIEADVTPLEIGHHLRVGDLVLPESVKLETDKGVVIAHVITPKKVEEEEVEKEGEVEEAAAPEEGAEPEVIKKGKAEEEGEGSKE
jgi:large subunit ribosomal protein L25